MLKKNAAIRVEDSIRAELEAAGGRSLARNRDDKKNYAEVLSRQLALRVANALRPSFPGILPDAQGRGQESRARSAKGIKRLDVNYSTVELGLGLGISIKTVNFRDSKSGRYTKNYTRADGELRAEASDYHVRQPYAVLAALVFMPADACDDAVRHVSSFGHAVTIFRFRAGRVEPTDDPNLFEKVFIGLYEAEGARFGDVGFFDVTDAPPKRGRPARLLAFADVLERIRDVYDRRNSPTFVWADAPAETLTEPVVDEADESDSDA